MKIYSPNRDYTGVSASVPFCNGVGETNDPHLIQWFKDHGYKVEESEAAPIEETLAAEIPTEEAPTEEAPAETKPAGKKGKA
nr:MAG TPA: hypothetical protein [Caudoviricetes sp.]